MPVTPSRQSAARSSVRRPADHSLLAWLHNRNSAPAAWSSDTKGHLFAVTDFSFSNGIEVQWIFVKSLFAVRKRWVRLHVCMPVSLRPSSPASLTAVFSAFLSHACPSVSLPVCVCVRTCEGFSAYQSVCMSVSLPVCVSVCLSVLMCVFFSACESVCMSVSLPVSPYVCLFLCLSACVCFSANQSVCLFLCV